jgi:uncharacterized protein with von Willebrand factor type A (vWA) domain
VKGGTDIGAVLDRALGLFDGRTGAHEAIVLLTDGEDLEGKGLAVAKTAKSATSASTSSAWRRKRRQDPRRRARFRARRSRRGRS